MIINSNIAKAQLGVALVQFLGQSVTAGQRSILPDQTVAVCILTTLSIKEGLYLSSACVITVTHELRIMPKYLSHYMIC